MHRLELPLIESRARVFFRVLGILGALAGGVLLSLRVIDYFQVLAAIDAIDASDMLGRHLRTGATSPAVYPILRAALVLAWGITVYFLSPWLARRSAS